MFGASPDTFKNLFYGCICLLISSNLGPVVTQGAYVGQTGGMTTTEQEPETTTLELTVFPNMTAEIEKRALSLHDPNSFSNPEEIRVDHIHLDWKVDFTREVIEGNATYDLVASSANQDKVILDVHSLVIKSIKDIDGASLKYEVGETYLTMGTPLTVHLPRLQDSKAKITIEYETPPSANALQWLSKEQTHEKEFPYMFSQCQAIHARSLLPCQDSPNVKASYSASVSAPKDLTVLMSAIQSGEPKPSPSDPELRIYEYKQTVKIPSYLIAIVVGRISSVEIGPRSRIWSEKEFLETAAFDFSETEKMIQTGEAICGEYVWGRYDILVLPPSFPYGGMENPCLTFVTPTILTGDKSLSDVIAHEITHSWTGNLVTNKNFEHFWLNEGFTRFIERKIVGRLGGEAKRQFSSHLGWSELYDAVEALGPENPLTKLVVDLKGVDPEDAFSRVPYEKGSNFLYYLEQQVGGPEIFEPFLKQYINKYAHKSIDTEEFKSYFTKYFTKGMEQAAEVRAVDWDSWLFTTGMPPIKPEYDTSLLDPCLELKDRWMTWDPEAEPCPFSAKDLTSLGPNQIIEFLNQIIISNETLSPAKAKALNEAYNLRDSKNAEVVFRWIRIACKAELLEELPLALDFVTKHGRLKFIQPIYRDLYKWEAVRQQAIDTFIRNRPTMMHASAFVTAKNLKLRL